MTASDIRDGDILTRGDALQMLGFSATLLDRLVRSGELPVIRTPSGYRLFLLADLKELASKRARRGLKVRQ
jgi:hypothetical protein